MSNDAYIVAILLLLPLTAGMVVTQVNPYHALVMRGILGAVAALVYALFGAADVALTEALVGTMLSITLYAIAVRSSLKLRLGVVATDPMLTDPDTAPAAPCLQALRQCLRPHHMGLEVVSFPHQQALQTALAEKAIHAAAISQTELPCHLQVRVLRLYEIFQAELPPAIATLSYINTTDLDPAAGPALPQTPDTVEGQV